MRTQRRARLQRIAIAIACATAAAGHPARAPAHETTAIRDVTIIDVEHRRRLAPRTVVIADGAILAIGAHPHLPLQARVVDGKGRFLIPGLVDAHVHLFNIPSGRAPNEWALPLFVANGVTGVREMAASPASIARIAEWERERRAYLRVAPRILDAGVAVRTSDAASIAADVDAAARAGAGFIKVFSETTPAAWRAILDAARAHGLRVAGHAPAGTPLLQAVADGLATNEHLMQAFEACASDGDALVAARPVDDASAMVAARDRQEPQLLAHYDRRRCREVARTLHAAHSIQVPTLVLNAYEAQPAADATADPRWPLLRADEQARWLRGLADAPSDAAFTHLRWNVTRSIAADFHRAGVVMLAGTDTPMPRNYPGFSLHDELARLVEAGFTPWEALRAATLAPAAAFGAGGGRIAVGERADLVLLDADPAQDIGATRRIRAVIVDGRVYERAELDAMLGTAPGGGSEPLAARKPLRR